MRLLVTILIIIFYSSCEAQAIYKMSMDIQEIYLEKRVYTESVGVYWGIKQDTVCFLFLEKLKCYYPINLDKLKKKTRDRVRRLKNIIDSRERGREYELLLTDNLNEIYYLRFIFYRKVGEMIIFITNIEFGVPSYVLTLKLK